METNVSIGLTEVTRKQAVALLQPLLADETLLTAKTRAAHWNIRGPHFAALHEVFGGQYDALAGQLDEIAERVRSLGGYPVATLREYLALTRLQENSGPVTTAEACIAGLLADHEAIAAGLRVDVQTTAELGDVATSDFLTGVLAAHEKTAWMLRASLPQ